MILERVEPAQGETAIESDPDFVRPIGTATVENIAGVEQGAALGHDGLGKFFRLGLSFRIPSMTSGYDDGRTVVCGEVREREVDAD